MTNEKISGAEALMRSLEHEGVEVLFGYPGGAIMPTYDALYDHKETLHHILVRHEQCAAHMADGFTRASGEPGVCLVTSGPGVTNAVTGVATAQADSIPMMVLTGQVASGLLGMGAFQEVDAFSLMMPITKYNYRVLELQQLPQADLVEKGILGGHMSAGQDDKIALHDQFCRFILCPAVQNVVAGKMDARLRKGAEHGRAEFTGGSPVIGAGGHKQAPGIYRQVAAQPVQKFVLGI